MPPRPWALKNRFDSLSRRSLPGLTSGSVVGPVQLAAVTICARSPYGSPTGRCVSRRHVSRISVRQPQAHPGRPAPCVAEISAALGYNPNARFNHGGHTAAFSCSGRLMAFESPVPCLGCRHMAEFSLRLGHWP